MVLRATDGQTFLNDPEVVRIVLRFLDRWTRQTMCHARVYCFLPDRLEAIVEGHEEMSQPLRALEGFEESISGWLVRSHPEWSLQTDVTWGHIPGDDLKLVTERIIKLPVERGLCSDPYEYPFLGSMGFNLWEAL